MKRFLRVGRFLLVSLVASFALLGMNACGPEGTLTPSTTSDYTLVRYDPAMQPQLSDGSSGSSSASKTIKASDGGKICYGNFTLVVPPGALSQDVTFSMTSVSGTDLECAIEPTGLTFLKPATLIFDYKGTSADPASSLYIGSRLTALWLDPSKSLWTPIKGTDYPDRDEFWAPLSHLSYYSLAI